MIIFLSICATFSITVGIPSDPWVSERTQMPMYLCPGFRNSSHFPPS